MAFRFRLEKVMRHRRHVVDARSREVAEAGRAVRSRRERIEALEEDRRRVFAEAGTGAGGSLRPAEMQARHDWLLHLAHRLEREYGLLAAAERELEDRRRELTAAWRDLEVLRRLEERRREEWAHEQRRREGIEMDEVGQIRADRARRAKVAH